MRCVEGTPDESRVIALFEEQDAIHRGELLSEKAELEPLFLLIDLRFRFAASMRLLGRNHRTRIRRIVRHAETRFATFRPRQTIPGLLKIIRDRNHLMSWDAILGREMETLRGRFAAKTPGEAGGSEPVRATLARDDRRSFRNTLVKDAACDDFC